MRAFATTTYQMKPAMFEIRTDTEKNRLYITIGVVATREEYDALIRGVKAAIPTLSDGFTCLTDLREYQRVGEAEEELILSVQRQLKRAGISRTVRVERRHAIQEHVQFEAGSLEAGYPSDTARSIEDGEALLDNPRTRPFF